MASLDAEESDGFVLVSGDVPAVACDASVTPRQGAGNSAASPCGLPPCAEGKSFVRFGYSHIVREATMDLNTDGSDAAHVTRTPAPARASIEGMPTAPWGCGGTCTAEARTPGVAVAYVAIVSGLSMWALAFG